MANLPHILVGTTNYTVPQTWVGTQAEYNAIATPDPNTTYYITDGVALPIIWEKKDEKSKTIYKVKENGEELKVNDGNTYFQIYPTNGGNLTFK